MTFKEARAYLNELSAYGRIPGLNAIRELMHELKDPQDELKFIHIAGTNGKGSVNAYASCALKEAGFKAGSYTSPPVMSHSEKIKINGECMAEEDFACLIGEVRAAADRMCRRGQRSPTVFEAETAAAFLHFKRQHCDIAVVEAGLGGSLDATNIIKNTQAAAFASISMDHMEELGAAIDAIAENKSGIIKPGCAVVTGRQDEAVMEVILKRADKYGCMVYAADDRDAVILKEGVEGMTFSYKEWKNIRISMAGRHQVENAITALALIQALREKGYNIGAEAVYEGFSEAFLPGRFTCINKKPLFIVDGAHNEGAALMLRRTVLTFFPDRRLIFIMGIFKDKEYGKIAKIMAPMADRIYTVDLPDEKRTLSAEALKEVVEPYCRDAEAAGDIERAADMALNSANDGDVVLAFGSLSYLGQLTEYVREKRAEI